VPKIYSGFVSLFAFKNFLTNSYGKKKIKNLFFEMKTGKWIGKMDWKSVLEIRTGKVCWKC
jgi:hypothetical protein